MTNHDAVWVQHGIYGSYFPFAGLTLLEIKAVLSGTFEIDYFAQGIQNGAAVGVEALVHGGDELCFLRLFGSKGARRSDSQAFASSLISAYPQLTEIGDRVKAKNLGRMESIDETIRLVTELLQSQFGPTGPEQMLTIREVASLLGCSYGEARNRMLTGRIRSVKDGRWHRTRRAWLEEYLSGKMIAPDTDTVPIPLTKRKRRQSIGVKPSSIALEFLRDLEED